MKNDVMHTMQHSACYRPWICKLAPQHRSSQSGTGLYIDLTKSSYSRNLILHVWFLLAFNRAIDRILAVGIEVSDQKT